MRTEVEPRRIPERSRALLDGLAARIRPDDPRLEAWYPRYVRQHRRRLAVDLALVERHVRLGARILEVGAIPPLTTAALAELGYAVRGVDLAPARFGRAIAELGLDVAELENRCVLLF